MVVQEIVHVKLMDQKNTENQLLQPTRDISTVNLALEIDSNDEQTNLNHRTLLFKLFVIQTIFILPLVASR